MADDDLEAELMDLASNEHVYLPSQPQRSSVIAFQQQPENARLSGQHSNMNVSAPTPPLPPPPRPQTAAAPPNLQHMLRAAAEQRQERQQQARERFSFSATSSSSSLSASGLAASLASSLGIRTAGDNHSVSELEEQRRRMQAAFSELARLRQQQIVERIGVPNAQPQPPPTWDPHADAMIQMVAKLDTVVDASLKALHVPAPPSAAALWTQVLQDLPSAETDYLAKAADEKFEQQMKYLKAEHEVQQCVERHLATILLASVPTRHGQNMAKTMKHSLGQLLRGFRTVFLACYEHVVTQYTVDQVAQVLPLVSTDVVQFASILVQLLLFKYPFVAQYKDHVRRCVVAALFELLQPTLHGLYVGAFRTEDAVMEDIARLKRMNPPADFGIAPIFRLDGTWTSRASGASEADDRPPEAARQHAMHQFGASIYRMNNLVNIRSPWVKVQALVFVCRDIDAAIKSFYAQQPVQPTPEEINMYVAFSLSFCSLSRLTHTLSSCLSFDRPAMPTLSVRSSRSCSCRRRPCASTSSPSSRSSAATSQKPLSRARKASHSLRSQRLCG